MGFIRICNQSNESVDEQMNGQLSIFDVQQEKRRPCDYPFKRYIGQKVELSTTSGMHKGKVEDIEPYYTTVNCHGFYMVGTPSTMAPIDINDYDEEYKAKIEERRTNERAIHEKDIESLKHRLAAIQEMGGDSD